MNRWTLPLLMALIASAAVPAFATEADTIAYFASRGGYVYYNDPTITMQAARFVPRAPGTLHEITVTLGGRSASGGATLHLFGLEGGSAAPLLERDLIKPIRIHKTQSGVEKITVRLAEPVAIDGSQFFVALDGFSPDVILMSDRRTKRPSCVSSTDPFYYQFLRLKNAQWRWGTYAFVIEAIVEYPTVTSPAYLVNATADLGISDSLRHNRSIAWADLNRDGYLDLLVDGRLYRNLDGARFEEIGEEMGLAGSPLANAFIDADNDGKLDVLFLGSRDTTDRRSVLFRNDGEGRFTRRVLDLPAVTNPTSFSIADANDDGRLDVFVGQAGIGLRDQLWINDIEAGFTAASEMTTAEGTRGLTRSADARSTDDGAASYGSQWVDVDNDGDLELFVATRQNTAPALAKSISQSIDPRIAADAAGCHWADFDNDGDIDLLLPRSVAPADARTDRSAGTAVLTNAGTGAQTALVHDPAHAIEYEATHAGGAWGDVNNDGLLDFIVTTSCACRFADLYVQQPGGGFDRQTFDYGLYGAAAGQDAIWADYNNDGTLDLTTIIDGKLRLLRNTGSFGNGYVAIDLDGADAAGARVTVQAGERRYTQTVSSGRGLLMQDPLRLHFGIGGASRVDTVTVQWPGGRTERLTDLEANRLYRLGDGAAVASSGTQVMASPNPFTTHLTIGYEIAQPGGVRLEVFTLDGRKLATLVAETKAVGRYEAVWHAVDDGGKRLPQGTYIYKLTTDDGERIGKAVMTR